METRENEYFVIKDFERKAQELIHIMLHLCEKHVLAAEKATSPTGDTMAEAALAVKASIRTFIFIERLPYK